MANQIDNTKMTAPIIAQLIIALGPVAFDVIKSLTAVWNKPELTPDEVQNICDLSKKSYESYFQQ